MKSIKGYKKRCLPVCLLLMLFINVFCWMRKESPLNHDENILLDATRYMLDWQSEFEKDAPIFQNYQKFRDDWDAILKSYGFVKR